MISSHDFTMSVDDGQIHLFGTVFLDDYPNAYDDAVQDAISSRRFVGEAAGLVVLLTPGQSNDDTPLRLEVWAQEPPDDSERWDHEVDVDIDAPTGFVAVSSVGGEDEVVHVPVGSYRARVSGRGFDLLGFAGANGEDSYRVRLFPRAEPNPPALRRSWPGWAEYI